tara:strand:- start:225 stop:848 length:624 start_codon:yes stop_codon:yes gene_type:complete
MAIINQTRKFQLLVLSVFALFLSCRENEVPGANIEELDNDMEVAKNMVDLYLTSRVQEGSERSGRSAGDKIDKIDKSITVLKFKDGKLMYKTNTDTITGYLEVVETTVTAYVKPGELIFWFAGGGVTSLDSIDFDAQSVDFLDELPYELRDYDLWVVQVPEEYDTEHSMLKYDIVYKTKESAEFSIRLDPKVQVVNSQETVESNSDN